MNEWYPEIKTEMIIEEMERRIEVMQAWLDGKDIEVFLHEEWMKCNGIPNWKDLSLTYRVHLKPDFIDWNSVSVDFRFMARNKDGSSFLYSSMPIINKSSGVFMNSGGDSVSAKVFSSFVSGDVDWKDSLIARNSTSGDE